VPAGRGCARARRHGLLVLVARLPQMRVEVDEARGEDQAARIDPLGVGGYLRREAAVGDRDVAHLVRAGGRDGHPSLFEDDALAHTDSPAPVPPSNRYSSAMRIAIPFVTCSSITEVGWSATSESISTPRFIGPGCMISAVSGSIAARSLVRPNRRAYS